MKTILTERRKNTVDCLFEGHDIEPLIIVRQITGTKTGQNICTMTATQTDTVKNTHILKHHTTPRTTRLICDLVKLFILNRE